MNEVKEFILRRAMTGVAQRGLYKEAGLKEWAKTKYEQATDWLARKMSPEPVYQEGQIYTTDLPSTPFSDKTTLLRKDDDKTTRQSTLGDRRDWLVGKGIRQGIQEGKPYDAFSYSVPDIDAEGTKYYGPLGKLEWLNKKYGGNAGWSDIASQFPTGQRWPDSFARPLGVYLPEQMTSKQMYYAPYLDFFDASDDYKDFNNRINNPKNWFKLFGFAGSALSRGAYNIYARDSDKHPSQINSKWEKNRRANASIRPRRIRVFPEDTMVTMLHEIGHGAMFPLTRMLDPFGRVKPFIKELKGLKQEADTATALRWGSLKLSPEDEKVYGGDHFMYNPFFTYYQDLDEAATAIHNHNVREKNEAYIKKNNLKDVVAPGYSHEYQEIVGQLEEYQERIAELSKNPKANKRIIKRLIDEHNQLVKRYNSVGGNFNLIK